MRFGGNQRTIVGTTRRGTGQQCWICVVGSVVGVVAGGSSGGSSIHHPTCVEGVCVERVCVERVR